MPKVNFQQTPHDLRNKMFRRTSNCDSLVRRIKEFYFEYEGKLSLEDKTRLLSFVRTIDNANKVLAASIRKQMYVAIEEMKKEYNHR